MQYHLCALSRLESCRKRIQHQQGIIGWKFARKIVSVTKNGIWPHQLRQINIHEYELPSDLLKSCKLSNRRYNAALEETKEQEKIGTVARKRKLIDEDIQVAGKKKDEVTKCIEVLKTDADKLSIEAEERTNLDLLTKANSFRKTILEKEKVLKDLEDSIIKMEESKKDFK